MQDRQSSDQESSKPLSEAPGSRSSPEELGARETTGSNRYRRGPESSSTLTHEQLHKRKRSSSGESPGPETTQVLKAAEDHSSSQKASSSFTIPPRKRERGSNLRPRKRATHETVASQATGTEAEATAQRPLRQEVDSTAILGSVGSSQQKGKMPDSGTKSGSKGSSGGSSDSGSGSGGGSREGSAETTASTTEDATQRGRSRSGYN